MYPFIQLYARRVDICVLCYPKSETTLPRVGELSHAFVTPRGLIPHQPHLLEILLLHTAGFILQELDVAY